MTLVNKILSIFIAFIIVIASSGFWIEKYLCCACKHEHQEISFAKFCEYKHDHVTKCKENHNEVTCFCKDKAHSHNSKILFFSIKLLFVNSIEELISNFLFIKYLTINWLSNILLHNFNFEILSLDAQFVKLKQNYFITNPKTFTNINILNSTFIL